MTDQINPFYSAYPTSLSSKSEHDWRIASAHWSQFSGFSFCRKLPKSKKWMVEGFGISGPLFSTKKAAEEYVSNLFMAEGRWRAHQRWEAEHNSVAA